MKKWEGKKDFNFPHFCSVGNGKVKKWKKVSLYKILVYFFKKWCPIKKKKKKKKRNKAPMALENQKKKKDKAVFQLELIKIK